MPLNITNAQTASGADGAHGSGGTQGNSSQRRGGAGSAGQVGGVARQLFASQSFQGDAGGDQINLGQTAVAGNGGYGGIGGNGFDSSWTRTSSSPTTTIWVSDAPGNGGNSGAGGAGGVADVSYQALTFLLGAAQQGSNRVQLSGSATGGSGYWSSYAGNGGRSENWSGTWFTANSSGTWSDTYTQQAAPGGLAGNGGRGGNGGMASVRFSGLAVAGDNLDVQLNAQALGGTGSGGGAGGRGGNGLVGQPGGAGGRGGDGGLALAEVRDLAVETTGGTLALAITLTARGQWGGSGGSGGGGGSARSSNSHIVGGSGTSVDITTYAAPGPGGAGGSGGAATAMLLNSVVRGNQGGDQVNVNLRAQGGAGGTGAAGPAAEASSSSSWINNGVAHTHTTNRAPAGLPGRDGLTGMVNLVCSGNTFELGEGDDLLTLSLLAPGPLRKLSVANNVFDGGLGWDTLVLGNGNVGEESVLIDVANQRLSFGAGISARNTLLGFEGFTATGGNDRIIDGAGDHDYRGGAGKDQYTFTAGLAGKDVIRDFSKDDRLVFAGFGFRSVGQVMTTFTFTAEGAWMNARGESLLLAGVSRFTANQISLA